MNCPCQWQGIGYLDLMTGGMVSSPISVEGGEGGTLPCDLTNDLDTLPQWTDTYLWKYYIPELRLRAVMLKRKQKCTL